MKFNEYELALIKGKLKLKTTRQFNKDVDYIDDILAFVIEQYDIPLLAIEKAFVIAFNTYGNMTGIMQIGLGDFRDAEINLNSAFKFLLLNNAMSCIFIHNHPLDADLTPSATDYQLHATVLYLCSALKIDLRANVIIQGTDEYYDIGANKKEDLVHDW